MRDIWPMGCKKTPELDKVEQLLKDDNYVGQQKIDGVRGILQFDSEGVSHITTRGASLENPDKPIEITHRLPQLQMTIPALAGTVLDGEIWAPHLTSAQISGMVSYKSTVAVDLRIGFYNFDILYLKNVNLEGYALKKRLEYLTSISSLYDKKRSIKYVKWAINEYEKRQLLSEEFEAGREGIVLKNLFSTYKQGTPTRDSKPANHWYKVKKKDTVDVIITGSEPPEKYYRDTTTGVYDFNRLTKPYINGWFGSINFQFKDENGIMKYGSCSGLTDEMRERLCNGSHGISDLFIGRVMEVEYMEKTSDGNLRHPRFIRIREREEKNGGV